MGSLITKSCSSLWTTRSPRRAPVIMENRSSSKLLFDIVLELKLLETKHRIKVHVMHNLGKRMICQGTDGLLQGDSNERVRDEWERYVVLFPHQYLPSWNRLNKLPGIEGLGSGMQGHSSMGCNIWAPAPVSTSFALDQITEARSKRLYTFGAIIVLQRVVKVNWGKKVAKEVDIHFEVPAGDLLKNMDNHEPITVGILFAPFVQASTLAWASLRDTTGLQKHLAWHAIIYYCQLAEGVCCFTFLWLVGRQTKGLGSRSAHFRWWGESTLDAFWSQEVASIKVMLLASSKCYWIENSWCDPLAQPPVLFGDTRRIKVASGFWRTFLQPGLDGAMKFSTFWKQRSQLVATSSKTYNSWLVEFVLGLQVRETKEDQAISWALVGELLLKEISCGPIKWLRVLSLCYFPRAELSWETRLCWLTWQHSQQPKRACIAPQYQNDYKLKVLE